jgi:glutamine cyclotransferase
MMAIMVIFTLSTFGAYGLLLDTPKNTPIYDYRIINTYPHDPEAFTQGLIYHQGILYESTGLWGRSSLRQVELETGKILQIRHLNRRFFGEGITLWQGNLFQLTWRSKIGFIYNRKTFENLDIFTYSTEGWGITHDSEKLIMSDGSDKLFFLDPDTFQKTGHLQVHDQGKPIFSLNELEYVNGEIFANIWQSHFIARISPKTGQVLGWINLSRLVADLKSLSHSIDVLNGIAYDKIGKRLFVTGKLWPQLFEIQLVSCHKKDIDSNVNLKRGC